MTAIKTTKKTNTPKYENSNIYKLCCNDLSITDIYIGSTTNFRNRKYNHKSDCHNSIKKKYHRTVYKFIRDNGGWDNWSMILLETTNCTSKQDLIAKERIWYEQLNPKLNTNYPGRSCKEHNSIMIVCKCGIKHSLGNKSQHLLSTKHIQNTLATATPK